MSTNSAFKSVAAMVIAAGLVAVAMPRPAAATVPADILGAVLGSAVLVDNATVPSYGPYLGDIAGAGNDDHQGDESDEAPGAYLPSVPEPIVADVIGAATDVYPVDPSYVADENDGEQNDGEENDGRESLGRAIAQPILGRVLPDIRIAVPQPAYAQGDGEREDGGGDGSDHNDD